MWLLPKGMSTDDPTGWSRRRDLEGGKQAGVWLEADGSRELYVEDLGYKDQGWVVWLYDDAGDEWTHLGDYDGPDPAFGRALEWLEREG